MTFREIWGRFTAWTRRSRLERQLAAEFETHLEFLARDLVAQGMSPADAQSVARRRLGNVTALREISRSVWGFPLLDTILQDVRYAARSMRRTPAFALVATVCLAIGISVNTAAFSLLNALLFRDYPGVVRRQELVGVLIGQETANGRSRPGSATTLDWEVLRTGLPGLSGIAAFRRLPVSVQIGGEPRAVRGHLVSSNFFEVLGTRPAAGRFMLLSDDPGVLEGVVVISHRFWKGMLGGGREVVGQVLTIGTRQFSIIGVAPEGFFGLHPAEVIDADVGAPELFIPLAAAPFLGAGSPDDNRLEVFGRLGNGATLAAVQTQADVAVARVAAAHPGERKGAFAVVRAGGGAGGENAEITGLLLSAMAVPAIILLVACANLANQLLARAVQRRREIAVRLSLGATRGRVVRQLLTETALLAVSASAIGVILARWLLDGLRGWVLATPFRIPIDWRVLAFTTGLALLTALAFGLVPALGAARPELISALKDGGAGSGYRRSRLRSALVLVQIAGSLAMIAVSSVFTRSAEQPPSPALEALAHRSLLVSMNLDLLGFDSLTGRAYQTAMLERLEGIPGVVAVGMAPFSMFEMLGSAPMTEPGQDPGKPAYNDLAEVSGDWFAATNTQAVRGRLFSAAERAGPPTVAVVDEELARDLWGTAEPLGRSLRIGGSATPVLVTVIGVIPTRQEVSFREPEGVVVIPGGGQYRGKVHFYIRTSSDAASMAGVVREAVRALDSRVPIIAVRTIENVAAEEVVAFSGMASGLVALGGVALALAALGLFGVLSFLVAQRRYEIGVRIALGAQRGDVVWMVLRQALRLGIGGVAAGMVLAVGTVALLRAIIHGMPTLDLPAFAGAALTMLLVALLASALPARRAVSVDPIDALRME